ncbi:MAG: AbrB/MazE/SpoVT family DNA-binding domain-containing protein [Nitrososphaeraceae archaeon]
MKNSSDLDEIENGNSSPNLYRRIQGLVGEQSFSLILPKQYANNLGIRKGDFVKVRQEENKIIIEKA